jgi:hypothetical protein
VIVLAAIVAAIAVPLGFALSLSSGASRPAMGVRGPVPAESVAVASSVFVGTDPVDEWFFEDIPESAQLLLMGTMLLGIAVAVRKSA